MSCRLDEFLKIVKGDFVCAVDGKKIAGQSIDAGSYGNYCVVSAEVENGKLLIGLKQFEAVSPQYTSEEKWVKEHKIQFGAEPSFF